MKYNSGSDPEACLPTPPSLPSLLLLSSCDSDTSNSEYTLIVLLLEPSIGGC